MEIPPKIRPLMEQAVRQRMAPFTLFFVRLRRKGRRWEMEEAGKPLNPSDKQNLDELRALVEETSREWAPVGTLAQAVGLACRASLIVGLPLPHAEQHLAALRALVRGDPQGRLPDAERAHEASWLYPVTKKGSVRFGWVFSRSATMDDTILPHAVSLSAVMGRLSGRLRLCRFCKAPFLAAYKWGRACKHCQNARAMARRPDVRRVLDRLRKQGGSSLREDALADLRVLSLTDWKTKWDKKDPLGRGRPLGTDNTVRRRS